MTNAPSPFEPTPAPITAAPDPAPEPEEQKPSPTEVMETLTGYDELAIEKAFGAEIEALIDRGSGLRYLRALAFVQELHKGAKHDEAKRTAMELTSKALGERFREPDPDDDPDLPGSAAGKAGA